MEEHYLAWYPDDSHEGFQQWDEEEEDWFLNEVPWEEYFNNGKQAYEEEEHDDA